MKKFPHRSQEKLLSFDKFGSETQNPKALFEKQMNSIKDFLNF